jgi:hypothetical protein
MFLLDNSYLLVCLFHREKELIPIWRCKKKYGKGVQVSAQQLGITRLPGNFPDKTESASSGQSDQAETLF